MTKKPILFVVFYLLTILIFAMLYYYFAELELDFVDSIYFSTVTITTLGYGPPLHKGTKCDMRFKSSLNSARLNLLNPYK